MRKATVFYRSASDSEAAFTLVDQMNRAGIETIAVMGQDRSIALDNGDTGESLTYEQAQARFRPGALPLTFQVERLTETAILPTRGSPGAAGLDLYYDGEKAILFYSGSRHIVPTGIALTCPEGCYARIAPRSGLAAKHGIDVLAGVVDRDYTGEVKVVMIRLGVPVEGEESVFVLNPGDRIAQVVFERCVLAEPAEVGELSHSQRGSGGFGSTGR